MNGCLYPSASITGSEVRVSCNHPQGRRQSCMCSQGLDSELLFDINRNTRNGPELLTRPCSHVILLRSFPCVRLPAIDNVAGDFSKQMLDVRPRINVTLKYEHCLHWVVVVYASIADINTCKADELLNFVCSHSVVPEQLPAHASQRPMSVRHQPAAELLPPWFDRPWVTCKREQT